MHFRNKSNYKVSQLVDPIYPVSCHSCRFLLVLTHFTPYLTPCFYTARSSAIPITDSRDGHWPVPRCTALSQDPAGFYGLGPKQRLTRFDGTHYKNFTLEDGFPITRSFSCLADSKDRVCWICLLRRAVAFYYKGKIHTGENDSLLKKLNIQDNIVRYAERQLGNVLLQEVTGCIW